MDCNELPLKEFVQRVKTEQDENVQPIINSKIIPNNAKSCSKYIADLDRIIMSLPTMGSPSGNSRVHSLSHDKVLKISKHSSFFDHARLMEVLANRVLQTDSKYAKHFHVDMNKYYTTEYHWQNQPANVIVEKKMKGKDAQTYFRDLFSTRPTDLEAYLEKFIFGVTKLIYFMYQKNFNHNDCHLGNIFIQDKECVIEGIRIPFTPILFDFDWSVMLFKPQQYDDMILKNHDKFKQAYPDGKGCKEKCSFALSHHTYTADRYSSFVSPAVDLAHFMGALLNDGQNIPVLQRWYAKFAEKDFDIRECVKLIPTQQGGKKKITAPQPKKDSKAKKSRSNSR